MMKVWEGSAISLTMKTGNQCYLTGHQSELTLAGDLARGLKLGEEQEAMMHRLLVHDLALSDDLNMVDYFTSLITSLR